jgi:sigma-B regulation protein RsbQ
MLVADLLAPSAVAQRYNVRSLGTGPSTLLFCNGYGCNQHVWSHLVPALLPGHRLVFFDQVGTGGADPAAYDPYMAMPRMW